MADSKSPVLLADPAPLGLMGFGLTTFILSLVNAGVLKGAGDVKVVIGLAAFYGGLAQLLAGMWEFRNGNTFGGVAFSSYGAFWLSFVALLIPGFGVAFGTAAGPTGTAVGWYLIGWAIITGMLALGTFRLNGGLVVVFVLLFITYILLAIGFFNGSGFGVGITAAGGWVGVLTAIAAWYVALAGVLRGVSAGKIALPIFPMS
ncbi:MAG TPA: acetate uptake transporter [Ktedonobacterales bacterium]|nr:acetate uptake transporter [Ktedonobacterales bacterium]